MRQFTDALGDIAGGRTVEELTTALALIVEAVMAARKPGEITLKLKIKPNGDSGVEIEDEVKMKAPAPSRPKTLMFVTSDNSLVRQDPRQQSLPLREVKAPAPAEDLKTA